MKFEVGQTYNTHSICDYDTTISITVAKRTAKRLTTTEGKTLGISEYEGIEQVRPWGRYSMCPVIGADDLVKVAAPAPVEAAKADGLSELMTEGAKLFTPEQFEDIKTLLTALTGVKVAAPVEQKQTAKVYNFADFKKTK